MNHEPAPASNESSNPELGSVIGRRAALQGGLALMATAFIGNGRPRAQDGPRPWFTPISSSVEDRVRIPEGYSAQVFVPWGDPVGDADSNPAFKPDGSNTAQEQAVQLGMNHDGMAFFPLPRDSQSSDQGILCINHEYIDRGLLHPAKPGFAFTPAQIEKEMNAHGVSVVEVVKAGGEWRVRRPSPVARRITASSRIRIGGPAKGHPLMQTEFDSLGEVVLGTLGNCANGVTPWGTYLACEENFPSYFTDRGPLDARLRRYGIGKGSYGWAKAGPEGGMLFDRFNTNLHPNEPNRFGWVVEIDPYDRESPPVKRTALGRFKHENAAVTLAGDGRVVVYMGDDEKFEYLYKFVSKGVYRPDSRESNRRLLDEGALYAARFNPDGTGEWLPLTKENPALRHFSGQAEILVYARIAGDFAGATKMDRPEWIAVDPRSRRVYVTLTNNTVRQEETPPNPRAKNEHGHILRWLEPDPASDRFSWDLFLLAGDPLSGVKTNQGTVRGDLFSSPDGVAFDARGVLWILTDVSSGKMCHPAFTPDRVEYAAFGNNQILAVDPAEGKVRRFLTGPVGCELTGFSMTPDGRTLFVNIQHPGEPLDDSIFSSDPSAPARFSTWPFGGRPRSATVVITRSDGGLIGT